MSGLAAAAGSAPEFLGARPLGLMLAMAALSLLPFVLLLMTSFVRISVVLSILKGAIGTPQIPPAPVVTGLALIMTLYVMAPTGARMVAAIDPQQKGAALAALLSGNNIESLVTAGVKAREPLRDFLLEHATPRDRKLFFDLALRMRLAEERRAISDRDFMVVLPAFLTSELRRAFEIGFLLFVPFLVVDMVVANLLLALGMHMLSPTTVSLPFKLLLFVLADGWQLVLRGLVMGFV